MRTIAPAAGGAIEIIDQTLLPHRFETLRLTTVEEMAHAIRSMQVRGAPLIGVSAAYGLALAMRVDPSDEGLARAADLLMRTRPTAVNLRWAIDHMLARLGPLAPDARADAALDAADALAEDDVARCAAIGRNGATLIEAAFRDRPTEGPVNILTHCNAGWLATVDWGTALAPVYAAFDAGVPVHVWVDETRPRNQGAGLTAWELKQHGVPHTVIADNAGGHLMQHGRVDLCLVGSDRTTATGDVCNKIGTYLKALAAHDNGVPFYAALPGSTIDWTLADGLSGIPIEERDPRELTEVTGLARDGTLATVRVTPDGSPAANYAFDVTPARYVTGLVTERGVAPATADGLARLFPEEAR